MAWLQFVDDLVGHVVWPVAVIILILLFRGNISSLLSSPRLTKIKAGPMEVEFKQELEDVKQDLDIAKSTGAMNAEVNKRAESEFRQEMIRLAKVSPRSVVMESHARLEQFLRRSVVSSETNKRPDRVGMSSLRDAAISQGLLTISEGFALRELTYLRNRIAHEPDQAVSASTALEYAEVVVQIVLAMRLASGKTELDGEVLGVG